MWGITTLDFFFPFLSRDKQENVNASVKGFGFALSFQDYAPMDALRAEFMNKITIFCFQSRGTLKEISVRDRHV